MNIKERFEKWRKRELRCQFGFHQYRDLSPLQVRVGEKVTLTCECCGHQKSVKVKMGAILDRFPFM